MSKYMIYDGGDGSTGNTGIDMFIATVLLVLVHTFNWCYSAIIALSELFSTSAGSTVANAQSLVNIIVSVATGIYIITKTILLFTKKDKSKNKEDE